MAMIVFGDSCCVLCEVAFNEEDYPDHIQGFTAFDPLPDTPRWVMRFNDAAVHVRCFEAWPLRDEFAARYNSLVNPGQRVACFQ